MSDEPSVTAPPELAEPAVTDDSPLSEHESVFGPPDPTLDGDAKKENDEKRAKVRHRAVSQQAGPEDVPRIQKFTKDLRERDEKLSAAETRIRELEARLQTPVASPTAQATTQPDGAARRVGIPPAGSGGDSQQLQPTRPKPSMDDIADDGKYKTFEAYQDDMLEWRDEQREAARAAKDKQQQETAQRESAAQEWHTNETKFAANLAEFKKTHTDYDTLAQQHGATTLPPAAYKAVHAHDNGPALVYYLFQHPAVLAEMQLLLDGRPPTADYVAIATRWLTSRMQAATTGSVASTAPLKIAPPPPNPVRTGHTTTGDDIPDDDAPLSAHEKKWGGKRR